MIVDIVFVGHLITIKPCSGYYVLVYSYIGALSTAFAATGAHIRHHTQTAAG